MGRRTAFVHVDLDNLWAIAECYGAQIGITEQNFLYDDALGRFRDLFKQLGIPSTFFVVGRDLEAAANRDRVAGLAAEGHRIGNHSMSHGLAMRRLDEAGIEAEVVRAHELIEAAAGCAPVGFRAPGYGVSPALIRVLTAKGYLYDSSVMPSPFGFVFRAMDWRLRGRTPGGRALRKVQFPVFGDVRAPVTPYRVDADNPLRPSATGGIWEVPVAAAPFVRLPCQAGVCVSLGRTYFQFVVGAWRAAKSAPMTFLLHLADLGDFPALNHPFFRGSRFFSAPVKDKLGEARYYLESIAREWDIVLVEDWLERRS